MICLCDIIALASALHSWCIPCPGQLSGDLQGALELALVQRRKVSLPQGELQINDQGRRLSAGLHASCPIHRQTCQGALPVGISGIFTEHFHHFCLLPFGLEHRSSSAGRQRETETGRGVGLWWAEVLEPNRVTSCAYLSHLPWRQVCSSVAMAATQQPTAIQQLRCWSLVTETGRPHYHNALPPPISCSGSKTADASQP